MPKTYKKRKSYGKKPYSRPAKKMYRKKLVRAKKGSRISKARMGTIIPDKAMVKLKWSIKDFSATTEKHYQIRGNGPWDPNYAVEGATAAHAKGWEFWESMYNVYKVSASKITMWANNTSTDPITIFIVPSRLASLPAIADPESEKYVKYKWLGQVNSSKSVGSVKHYFTTAKMFGLSKLGAEDAFKGRTGGGGSFAGTNPVAGWTWFCIVKNTGSPVVTALTADIAITITYYIEFTQLRTYQTNTLFNDSTDVVGGGDVDGGTTMDEDKSGVPP